MPAPTITPLPTPPSRSQSPETFSTDADAFLGALPDFATEANDQADYLDDLAAAVDADATAASNAAAVAIGASNYQGDYSAGTTYQIGQSVSYNSYRWVAKTVNTGVAPADGANWFRINDGDILGPASATNNALVLFDGTTGKLLKNGVGNGTLGALLASGGSGAAPSYLGQGTSGQVLISGGSGALPTWGNPLPSQTGNEGKFLSTDGTNASWVAVGSAVGDILYSTQAPSASWLACNGATYLQSSYPALYAKLGILGTPYAPIWTSYLPSQSINLIVYNASDSKYYAPMRNQYASSGALQSSTDGLTWTGVTNSTNQISNYYAYTGGRFVGYDQYRNFCYTSAYPFSTSTTFSSYDLSSIFNPGGYNQWAMNGIAVNRLNGDVMIVGKTTSNTYSYKAAIGTANVSAPTTWTNRTPPNSSDAYYIDDVATDGAGTYIIMYSGQSYCYRSTNLGASWTSITPDGNTIYSISYSNGFFYCTTWQGATNVARIYRSTDGVTWTLTATFPQSGGTTLQSNMYAAIAGNGKSINFTKTAGSLIMSGYDVANYSQSLFISSNNGTTWFAVPHGTGLTLNYWRFPKNDFGLANNRIFGNSQTSSPTLYNFQSVGYTYDSTTQFLVPNYGSLSTFSSTYAAPVSAFIKAA